VAYALVGTIGVASQGAVTTAVTPAWGTSENRTAGNLLILFVGVTGSSTFLSAPSGWISDSGTQVAGTSCTANIFYKVAAGADAEPTIAAVTSGLIAAQLAEFSGNSNVPFDIANGNFGTSSPVTSTLGAPDATSGELLLMCCADRRSAARAPNDTWTSNHGIVTQAGSNNGVSVADHYSFGYILATTSNAGADTVTVTLSVTTSITGVAVVGASFKLPPPPVIPDIIQQPLQPARLGI
jgi:hypothetical protein